MDNNCPDCNPEGAMGCRCPEHKLGWLKWEAKIAQEAYLEELKRQSRKGTQTERNQNAKL